MTNKKNTENMNIREMLPERTTNFLSFQEFLVYFDPKLANPEKTKNVVSNLLEDSEMVRKIANMWKDYGDIIGTIIGANIFHITQKLADDGEREMNPYNVQIYRRDIQTYKQLLKQIKEIALEFDRRVQEDPDSYEEETIDETQTDSKSDKG